uniref:Uncharacterized protein n=1 Tax=Cruciviridae sp. TaxID=1955495 RepID=A0A1S6LVM3_9VIRU|nr:hypothetical protein [Cruciviridae sp.]AQU11769.1 hypothetical protein [Cruciviridae sp.]
MDHFDLNHATGILPSSPFGTSPLLLEPTPDSNIGGVVQGSTNTYFFPANVASGNYMLFYYQYFSSGTGNSGVWTTTFTNAKSLFILAEGAAYEFNVVATANSTGIATNEFFTVTGSGASVTLTNNSNQSGNPFRYADFFVMSIPTPSD